MELTHMLYVVTAARLNSFTKAAQQLFISQSALSQSVKRLEDELGTSLFIRDKNKVTLTPAGEFFVSEAEKILEQSRTLRDHVSEMSENDRIQINCGISTFYSKYYLPKILPVVKNDLPNVKLNIVEDISWNLEEMVLGKVLDFCLVPKPLGHNGLNSNLLVMEKILLAFPPEHELLKKYPPSKRVPLSEVRNEPFIFLRARQRFTKMGMSMCEEAGFVPNIVYETMSWDTVDAIIAKGMGIGFVPDVVQNIKSPQKPVYRRILTDNDTREYVLAYRSDRVQTDVTKKLIVLIEKAMR